MNLKSTIWRNVNFHLNILADTQVSLSIHSYKPTRAVPMFLNLWYFTPGTMPLRDSSKERALKDSYEDYHHVGGHW